MSMKIYQKINSKIYGKLVFNLKVLKRLEIFPTYLKYQLTHDI